nr:hypothetical protein [Pseudonocardia nigra]
MPVLGVQRIGGDHRPGQRAGPVDPLQQRCERGDLVRLGLDLGLAEHDTPAVIERAEQMHPPIRVTSTANGLAVHRNRPHRPGTGQRGTGHPLKERGRSTPCCCS